MEHLFVIVSSWFYLHPWVSFSLSMGFIVQNLVFAGVIIGYAIDQKRKREVLDHNINLWKFWKSEAEALEKYRSAAGMTSFYKKESERKGHDNIRLRRKIGEMISMMGQEV